MTNGQREQVFFYKRTCCVLPRSDKPKARTIEHILLAAATSVFMFCCEVEVEAGAVMSGSGLLQSYFGLLYGELMKTNGPTLTPSVVYDDPQRGIKWLTGVLGLRLKSLYQTPDGEVAFAELVWRTGIVFVSARPPAENPWSKMGIASISLVAEDADAVGKAYQHARSMGADIVREMHVARTPAFPEGSTQFDLRDTEGNLWTIGTFQPGIE